MDRDDGRPLHVLDAELARFRFPAWRVWWIRRALWVLAALGVVALTR